MEKGEGPKLPFLALPWRVEEAGVGMETPPLHSSPLSVPFSWEEAPGKPRSSLFSTPTPFLSTATTLSIPVSRITVKNNRALVTTKGRIKRGNRRNGLVSLASTTHMLLRVYNNIKHVMTWRKRSRQERAPYEKGSPPSSKSIEAYYDLTFSLEIIM